MANIIALGHAVPEQIITNDDLAKFMDTSDEWIVARSGIKQRRWVREDNREFRGLCNYELALHATNNALSKTNITYGDIDAIVYATISPDNEMPGSGTLLASKISPNKPLAVFEVRNQCSGFLYGLMIANSLADTGRYSNILVVGVEIQSSGLQLSTLGRNTAVLFADGCGVAIVSANNHNSIASILKVKLFSNGQHVDKLGIKYPGFARDVPICSQDFLEEPCGVFPEMDGKFVFKAASLAMPAAIKEVVRECGLELSAIASVVPHQANQRILDMLSHELGGKIKVFSNIEKYGNTTAASIPLALSEAWLTGFVNKGEYVCLASFGAGFSWGASLIRMGD
jgi:3-oxoacyl-[acyl-carrier-protein] synthase III